MQLSSLPIAGRRPREQRALRPSSTPPFCLQPFTRGVRNASGRHALRCRARRFRCARDVGHLRGHLLDGRQDQRQGQRDARDVVVTPCPPLPFAASRAGSSGEGEGEQDSHMTHRKLLQTAAALAADYLDSLPTRAVAPTVAALDSLRALDRPFPERPTDPVAVLRELDARGSPATIASAGGRFFGFVVGGSLPAAVAANVLAAAWDQNAGITVLAPGAAAFEAAALRWLLEALHLPPQAAGGFVTGATMANFTCLAAARYALRERSGWDVEADGLFGAPPPTVVVRDDVHESVVHALCLLGLGRIRVARPP